MLPIERQKQIKRILESKKTVKISELSNELQVSEMTIRRDLKPFIQDGSVMKTFGGVSLATPISMNDTAKNTCIFCHRALHQKMTYKLIRKNAETEFACCAHCGLLRQAQLNGEVTHAICYDFLTKTTISAPLAFYVMDTSLDTGCCKPQVLTFEWQDHANKFVKGFGGKVYPFEEALSILQQKMQESNNQCHIK